MSLVERWNPHERLGTNIININWKNNDSEPRQESVFCFLSIPVQRNLLKGPEWAMCDHVCVFVRVTVRVICDFIVLLEL